VPVRIVGRHEWNIVLLDNGLDLPTPYGQFAVMILMGVAELERKRISERTTAALLVR
jgi:DNA invertase Pin-like site-specific DNA recombinase